MALEKINNGNLDNSLETLKVKQLITNGSKSNKRVKKSATHNFLDDSESAMDSSSTNESSLGWVTYPLRQQRRSANVPKEDEVSQILASQRKTQTPGKILDTSFV